MIVGDKLTCKRIIEYYNKIIKIDDFITIIEIDNKTNTISVKHDDNYSFYMKLEEKSEKNDHLDYIYDYFYTIQEIRQLKIKSL